MTLLGKRAGCSLVALHHPEVPQFVFLWSSSPSALSLAQVPFPPNVWLTLGSYGFCSAALGEAEQK